MKVALVFLALAAVATAASYGGYKHVDYSHVPYYKFDWKVQDEYYNDYGQYEVREKDHTRTNWWVALPGKGSMIKRDDDINAHAHQSYSAPSYKNSY